MKEGERMTKTEKRIRITCLVLFEILAVVTAAMLLTQQKTAIDQLPLACATILMLLLPMLAERILNCNLSLPFYLFVLFYAIGPMMGQCWKLYYLTRWWDKMLHIFGGITFAVVGAFIFAKLMGQQAKPCVVFFGALCFSVAVAAAWEFVEFSADQLLGMDMQNDTVVQTVNSYLLGASTGEAASLSNIQTVTINGTALPFSGYLDIGIIDTMWDMILESLGALATCVVMYFDHGKHPLLRAREG